MNDDWRLAALTEWLSAFPGLSAARPVPASSDASFRRYFRVQGATTYIAMDAPPPQEDCRPYVDVAGYLYEMGLHVPRVLEADLERGFLLLSDLGSTQYLHAIGAGDPPAETLYEDALESLSRLQREGVRYQSRLPAYDERMMRFELSLFRDWQCGTHLGLELTPGEEAAWRACCDTVVGSALAEPKVFVHRDYHSRNLMVTADRNPGVLDFQDAVEGPHTYDLVSLLKDCYVRWPTDITRARAIGFFDDLPRAVRQSLGREQFLRQFALCGVLRHLKAAGIFARLWHRDGKPGYLKDVPRTLGYVRDVASEVPEIAEFGRLLDDRVLPALEAEQ